MIFLLFLPPWFSLLLSMRLPFDEDLDEVGCHHILSKAKKVLRRAGLCGEEDEIYLEGLEGSEICV